MLGAAKKQIDNKVLRDLVPLNALSDEHFNELLQQTRIEEVPGGKTIFKQGDTDDRSIYLLSGKVLLNSKSGGKEIIAGGTDQTRFPIAHHFPRQVSATAKNAALIVRIDRTLLDALLTTEQTSAYEVVELEEGGDDDWMTRMLNSRTFEKLPPSNIQAVFMHMEAMTVRAGDVVVREGEEGDYFYALAEGECEISRENEDSGKKEVISKLSPGDSFGEETLIIGSRRNATVTMISNGMLMRLSKEHFEQFLKEPLLNMVSINQAMAMLELDGKWLDVRLQSEFENESLSNSLNIPLNDIRVRSNDLDAQQTYIAYCDTGSRSSVAGFLLTQRGYNVYVLEGGLASIPQHVFSKLLAGSSAEEAGEAHKGEVVNINVHPEANQRKVAAVPQAVVAELEKLKAEQEAERKQAAEEAMRIRAEAEVAKRKAQEELIRIRAEADEAKKKAEQETTKIRAEAEAAKYKAQEEAARFKAEAEAAKKKADEDSKRLQAERERAKKAVLEKSVELKAEIEAERDKARKEAEKLKTIAEQEALRLRQEAEQAIKSALEEAARLKEEQEKAREQVEENAARLRVDAEQVSQKNEEAARLKAEAEAARKRADDESRRMREESENARKKAEAALAELQKERDAARKVAEKEIAKLRAEAEKERSEAKEEALKLREEAENAKLKAEEDASRLMLEAENAKREVEADAAALREEEQVSRLQAQAEIARLNADAEAARLNAEEELRKKAEAEAARMQAQEEAARLKAEAEEVCLRKEDEANKLKAEAEALRKKAEEDVKSMQDDSEIEDARLKAEEQVSRLLAEAEAARLKAQEEAAAVKAEAEEIRFKAEEEASRIKSVAENASLEAQERANRLQAEAEIAKLRAEKERARLLTEQEQVRKKAEQAERLQTEAVEAQDRAGDDLERALLTGSYDSRVDKTQEVEPETEEIILQDFDQAITENNPDEVKAPASFGFNDEQQSETVPAAAESGGSKRIAIIGGSIAAVVAVVAIGVVALTGGETPPAEQAADVSVDTSVAHAEKALVQEKKQLESALRKQKQKEAAILRAKQDAARQAKTTAKVSQPVIQPDVKPAASPSREFRDRLKVGASGPLMVRLAAGSFKMGSPSSSPKFDERPRHSVNLTAIAIGKYEVTIKDYNRFATATGRGKLRGDSDVPAVKVSWRDAVAYTRWLSKQTGQQYRLPSEAEWEYAATGGASSAYWWGPVLKQNRANCFGCGSQWDRQGPAPVGSFGANGFGLHDTAGNVLEWVQDCYHKNYQGAPGDGGVWPEGDCSVRVARGGAFDTVADNIRRAKRSKFGPDVHLNNIGFRVVRDLH